jgi:hypothetical protein
MNLSLIPLAAALAVSFGSPASVAQDAPKVPASPAEKPADPKADEAAKKARDEEAKKQETALNKTEDEQKKEAEPYTRRLKGDSAGKLWEVVQKGDDAALKATGLSAELVETLKAERPNLKGLYSILGNEKLGKDVLKDLVAYGSSSKFAKSLEEEARNKEKAEKDRVRDKKKARRDREKDKEE